jgi:hypothetical protein
MAMNICSHSASVVSNTPEADATGLFMSNRQRVNNGMTTFEEPKDRRVMVARWNLDGIASI